MLVELVRFLSFGYWEKKLLVVFLSSLSIFFMEDLSRSWCKLSLSNGEDSGFVLPKSWRFNEFIIAAKYFTTRALNMDAIGRIFKQLWRCSDGFKIRSLTSHKALFVFYDVRDANRILSSKPSSFDIHVVVLQKYEENVPQGAFKFEKVMFWVQVYDIPICFMTMDVAEEICETIGQVFRSIGVENEEGGSFIRV